MASRGPFSEHDSMVRSLATRLYAQGHQDLCVDLEGYPKPTRLFWTRTGHGHIPDITARGLLIEVETGDSLFTEHTGDQLTLFAAYATQHGHYFALAVPSSATFLANLRLTQLGIHANILPVEPISFNPFRSALFQQPRW